MNTTVDTAAPTSSVTALPAFSPGSFMVSWSGTDNAGGSGIGTYSVFVSDNGGTFQPIETNTTLTSTTFTGQNGHTYGFYSIATDNVGNVQSTPSSAQSTTTVDTILPTSSVTALPAFSPGSFTLSWSGSDNPGGSGFSNYTIFVSADGGAFQSLVTDTTATSMTFTGVDGFTYSFYSIATDNAGNVQPTPTSAEATTRIDSAAPTSSVAALGLYSPGSFTVSWSGADNTGGSGINNYSVFFSDNGGPFQPLETDTTSTSTTFTGQNGHTYGFYSIATDNIGNVQPTTNAAQVNTTVDTVTPTSSLTALTAFSPGRFTVYWSGSDNTGGAGLASYSVFVSDNGGAFVPLLTNTTATFTSFAGVSGHSYGFYSVATDNVGNVQPTPSSAQATTTVDAIAPTSSITALPAFSTGSFTLSWSGTDNAGGSGVATYSVFVSDNGGPFQSVVKNTSATSTTFTGLDGHTYGFYSVATDNTSNVQTTPASAQASTTVDAINPTSTVQALPPISLLSFTVSWSGQDNAGGSGLASFDVYDSDNGGAWALWQNHTTQTSATWNGALGHIYTFYSVAFDNAGNQEPVTPHAEAQTQIPATQTLLSEPQSTSTPPTANISSMLKSVYHDTDPNSNPGIAVVSLSGNGNWQYLNGSTWTNIPAVSVDHALLLPQKDQLRFLPTALWNGTAGLLYVAWDGSLGGAGGFANAAAGAGSPFSSQAGRVSVTVTPAVHAPGWTAASTTLPPVQPGAANPGVTVQQAFGNVFSDPTASLPAGIAITSLTGAGSWQYALYDSGTHTVGSFMSMPPVSAKAALLLGSQDMIQFLPTSSGFTGSASLQVHAWDGSGTIAHGGTANLSKATSVGGTTPFGQRDSDRQGIFQRRPDAKPNGSHQPGVHRGEHHQRGGKRRQQAEFRRRHRPRPGIVAGHGRKRRGRTGHLAIQAARRRLAERAIDGVFDGRAAVAPNGLASLRAHGESDRQRDTELVRMGSNPGDRRHLLPSTSPAPAGRRPSALPARR